MLRSMLSTTCFDSRIPWPSRGQLSTITRAFDAEAIVVDPRKPAQGRADAVQHVLSLVAVLIGEHRVGERLAVPRRAAVVHHQRRPPARGVHLVPEVERGPLLPVRAAVDI